MVYVSSAARQNLIQAPAPEGRSGGLDQCAVKSRVSRRLEAANLVNERAVGHIPNEEAASVAGEQEVPIGEQAAGRSSERVNLGGIAESGLGIGDLVEVEDSNTLDDYLVNSIFLPFLIYAIAAIGLNILTGYCGQVSLGTGGFMAVGAYACYKLMTAFPDVNIFFYVIAAGGVTALVGTAFGLPSLRIKGFYLAVATLAAQFFLVWLFNKVAWFYNSSAS